MKNAFDGLISRLAQMGKKILSLKILQEKLLKLKNKEDWKKSETISENCGTTTEDVTHT